MAHKIALLSTPCRSRDHFSRSQVLLPRSKTKPFVSSVGILDGRRYRFGNFYSTTPLSGASSEPPEHKKFSSPHEDAPSALPKILMQGKTFQIKLLNGFMLLQTLTACTIGPLALLAPETQLEDKMALLLGTVMPAWSVLQLFVWRTLIQRYPLEVAELPDNKLAISTLGLFRGKKTRIASVDELVSREAVMGTLTVLRLKTSPKWYLLNLHPTRVRASMEHLLSPLPDQLAIEAAEKLAAMIGTRTKQTEQSSLPPSPATPADPADPVKDANENKK